MRKGIVLAVAVLALALPSSSGATFHLVKISEVGDGNPADYIELQMYAGGQDQVATHYLRTYDGDNGMADPAFQFPTDVGQGGNQRTILIGRDEAVTWPVQPDFVTPNLLVRGNGAACFLDTLVLPPIDCVAWGTWSATAPPGTGATAQPPVFGSGQATLQRNIAPNCPTTLDAADDTDDSFTDFALAAPTPRNNATAPTEVPCPGQPGGGGGGDANDPQTTITKEPKNKSPKRKAKWAFTSDEPGSTFECKLDGRGFKPCDSPYVKRVKVGKHKFEVAAIDAAGNRDETPDRDRFKRVPAG